MTEPKSVLNLLTQAGGAIKLADLLGLHQHTVERWKTHGIPAKHWRKIAVQLGVTLDTLAAISERARNAQHN